VKIHPLGTLTDAEKELVKAAIPELATNIQTVCTFSIYAHRYLRPDYRAPSMSRRPTRRRTRAQLNFEQPDVRTVEDKANIHVY
jgi:hypothetical protein